METLGNVQGENLGLKCLDCTLINRHLRFVTARVNEVDVYQDSLKPSRETGL